jgi:hypothetical protein
VTTRFFCGLFGVCGHEAAGMRERPSGFFVVYFGMILLLNCVSRVPPLRVLKGEMLRAVGTDRDVLLRRPTCAVDLLARGAGARASSSFAANVRPKKQQKTFHSKANLESAFRVTCADGTEQSWDGAKSRRHIVLRNRKTVVPSLLRIRSEIRGSAWAELGMGGGENHEAANQRG